MTRLNRNGKVSTDAIVIVVGSLINTTPTDVLNINTGNSVDATGIGVVVHFGVPLVSHRDATSLVPTPEIEKGQGTVFLEHPRMIDARLCCHLPLGQQGCFH